MTVALGIDVGGTKIAAGIVDAASGSVLDRRQVPTRPERGGAAVLRDCAALVAELGDGRLPVGIGLCELVDLKGRPTSAHTIDWRDLDPAGGDRRAARGGRLRPARCRARRGTLRCRYGSLAVPLRDRRHGRRQESGCSRREVMHIAAHRPGLESYVQ